MMVRTAMTLARTGRSMKNLAIMACPCAHQGAHVRAAAAVELAAAASTGFTTLPGMARWMPLTTTRSFGLRSALDDAQPAIDRVPGLDGALLDDILVVDDEHVASLLAVAQRAIGHEHAFDARAAPEPARARIAPATAPLSLLSSRALTGSVPVLWSRSGAM